MYNASYVYLINNLKLLKNEEIRNMHDTYN